jgi:hypothetical protein
LLEALANDGATASLDDTRTYEEVPFTIFGVAHAGGIVLEIAQLFAQGLFGFGRAGQIFAGLADQSLNVAGFQ